LLLRDKKLKMLATIFKDNSIWIWKFLKFYFSVYFSPKYWI
jgi:hypothetical protein